MQRKYEQIVCIKQSNTGTPVQLLYEKEDILNKTYGANYFRLIILIHAIHYTMVQGKGDDEFNQD